MTIIYVICKILTFPGAYMRGFLEHIVAKICRCGIESEGYLRLDELSGHTDHSLPAKKSRAVLMATLPGFIHLIFGTIFTITGLAPLAVLQVGTDHPILFAVYIAFYYVGVSMLCNLCPLVDDALLCRELIYGKQRSNLFVRIILFLPVHICVIGAYAEKYCINILIAAAGIAWTFITMLG